MEKMKNLVDNREGFSLTHILFLFIYLFIFGVSLLQLLCTKVLKRLIFLFWCSLRTAIKFMNRTTEYNSNNNKSMVTDDIRKSPKTENHLSEVARADTFENEIRTQPQKKPSGNEAKTFPWVHVAHSLTISVVPRIKIQDVVLHQNCREVETNLYISFVFIFIK